MQDHRLYEREWLEVRLTELIAETMASVNIGPDELDARLGEDRGYIRKLMQDANHISIKDIADIFTSLGCSLQLSIGKPYEF